MNKKQIQLLRFLEASGTRLYGMLLRLTLDESVAEDLMQETFVRLFEIKHTEKIENLQAYAYRIAMNLAFDRRRQQRPFLQIPEGHPDHRTVQIDQKLIQTEEITKILDAAEQLGGLTRECFVLRYVEQMEYEEIAERTQKSKQQVRALCSKGIQRIRQILNKHNTAYREAINE